VIVQEAPVEFKNDAQKETYEKVKGWMGELFGEMTKVYTDTPTFSIWMGSSLTYVNVYAWGDDRATIQCFAWVVTGAEMGTELMQFLLRENNTMRFGAFGIDDENDIFFKHSLMGQTSDKAELRAAILAVANTADDYDDKITSRWGGQRAQDR
jgi:Putative bacterial sensory transduction regulator